MPTYNYECGSCGHAFELFQSMTAPVKRKCPACGKLKLQRLIGTGAGFLFKGSGFYETDYRSSSYQQGAKSDRDSSSSGDSAGGGDKSGSSKPDSSSSGSSDSSSTGSKASAMPRPRSH